MFRRLLSVVLLGLLSFSIGFAQVGIKESEDWIVKRRVHTHLSFLAKHLAFPDTPIIKGAVLSATVGATSGEILVVGPTGADAKKYATALLDTAKEVGATEPVLWSQEDDCAAAQVVWGKGTFGRVSGGESLNVGGLISRLKSVDPNLYVSVRVPLYAHLQQSAKAAYTSSKYRYFDWSKADAGPVMTVRAEVAPWLRVAVVLFIGLVPICSLVGFFAGISLAKRESIPIAKRRKLYSKFVYFGTFGAIFLHTPLAFGLIFTGQLAPIGDLWMGSTTTAGAFAPFLTYPIFIILPVSLIAARLERKLFGPTVSEKEILPKPTPASPEEMELRKKQWRIVAGLIAVGSIFWLGSDFVFAPKNPWKLLPHILGILLVTLSQPIVSLIFRKANAKFPTLLDDSDLSARANVLASRLGVKIRNVRVAAGPLGRLTCYASASRSGDVTISLRANELLTEAERDFILAHELAHVKLAHFRGRLLVVLPAFVMLLPWMLMPFMLSGRLILPFSPVFLLAPALLALPYCKVASAWLMKRQEFEADQLAFRTTGDLESARSALRKMTLGTAMPHLHDIDEQGTHPAMWRRLERLDKAPL